MPPPDQPASSESQSPAGQERKSKTASAAVEQRPLEPPTFADLVAITVDPMGGRIVRLEYVGQGGERHELSNEETSRLAVSGPEATLQRVLEQAFQAGIDCVLGEQAEEEEQESEQDAELSRVLLQSLIERSPVARLMKQEVLDRAIIGTLIKQAAVGRTPPARGVAAN